MPKVPPNSSKRSKGPDSAPYLRGSSSIDGKSLQLGPKDTLDPSPTSVPQGKKKAPLDHLNPDVLKQIFSHVELEDVETLKNLRSAHPSLKYAVSENFAAAEAQIARHEVEAYLNSKPGTAMSPGLIDIVGSARSLELDCYFNEENDVTYDSVSIRLQGVLEMAAKLQSLTLEDMARGDSFGRLAPAIKQLAHLTHLSVRTELANDNFIRHLRDIVGANTHIVDFNFPDLIPWLEEGEPPLVFPDTLPQLLLPALAQRNNLQSLGDIKGLVPLDAPLYMQVLKNNPTLTALRIDYSTYEHLYTHDRDIGSDVNKTLEACSGMNHLESLDINIHHANKSTAQIVTDLLERNRKIESVSLGGIDLGSPESIYTAATIIANTNNLIRLELNFLENDQISRNGLGTERAIDAFKALTDSISSRSNLQHYDVWNISLKDESANIYFSAIEKLTQLRTSSQQYQNLPPSSLARLAQAMAHWLLLKELAIWPGATDNSSLVLLSPGLVSLKRLESISLNLADHTDPNTVIALAFACLPLPQLKKISVDLQSVNLQRNILHGQHKDILTSVFAKLGIHFSAI